MLYAGIDYHKRYSQVHVVDERGRTRASARLTNDLLTVSGFFSGLGEPCRAVIEAGWNWGVMYDWLDTIKNVSGVELILLPLEIEPPIVQGRRDLARWQMA